MSYISGMRREPRLILATAVLLGAAMPSYAGQFPWEPAEVPSPPPINSTQHKAPSFRTPDVAPPSRVVPGHNTTRGYVPTYESSGPVQVTPEPGQKSQGWVPGHHDTNGAWVPGHPE